MKLNIRHFSRMCLIQALYSWQLSGNSIKDIKLDFLSKYNQSNIDIVYFCELLLGVSNNAKTLDQKIIPCLSRGLKNVDPIEKSILRLAMFELFYRNDIPYKVVIDEAIELAKIFGSNDSYKFINGVLNKVLITYDNISKFL